MNLVVVKNIKKILKQPFESLFWKLGAPRIPNNKKCQKLWPKSMRDIREGVHYT